MSWSALDNNSAERAEEALREQGVRRVADGLTYGSWSGMEVSPVTMIWRNRSTHSDVMATVTSLLGVHEMAEQGVGGGKVLGGGRTVLSSLSIPASKQNRELGVERKLFLERLHKERAFRAQVENGAAIMIQASARGLLGRRRVRTLSRRVRGALNPAEPEEADEQPAGSSSRGAKRARRRQQPQGGHAPAGADPEFERVQDETRMRRYLASLRKETERAMAKAGLPRERGMADADRLAVLLGGKRRRTASTVPRDKLHAYATRLQCLVRRRIARRAVQVRRLYVAEEQQRRAVVLIQARYRSHYTQQRKLQLEQEERERAAVLIQSCVRRHLDARFATMVKHELRIAAHNAEAATVIKGVLQQKVARKRVAERKAERASVVVQRHLRGHLVRKSLLAAREAEEAAAVAIQGAVRRRLSQKLVERKREDKQRREGEAASGIQALCRGRAARKQVRARATACAAVTIQCAHRQRRASKELAELRQDKRRAQAAVAIQAQHRRRTAARAAAGERKQRKEAQAATSIQSSVRKRKAAKQVAQIKTKRTNEAATKVQALARRRASAKAVQCLREDKAAAKIQRAVRRNSARAETEQQRKLLRQRLEDEAEAAMDSVALTQRVRRASRDDGASTR
jgi:hypothetical protein